MIDVNKFDVLVVYTQNIATSSMSTKKGNINPFALAPTREHYSQAYAYFLKICEKKGLKAAFTTSKDIIGPGMCKSYWTYENNSWKKINKNAFAPIIFDKVSPLRKNLKVKRALLFSDISSKPFNDKDLLTLFNDKLKTANELPLFTIPTVNITKNTIESAIKKLTKKIITHKNSEDFSSTFILKDRFGAGGDDIHKIGDSAVGQIANILKNNPKISYILQPFANFENGYNYNSSKGYTDIRIIFAQGKVVQRYLRTAKVNDFRCNEHQGGTVSYINDAAIPESVKKSARKIMAILDKKDALFALDFIVSDKGNAYFLEGNINPGIYWGNSVEDKINTKKLINVIITEIDKRTTILKEALINTVIPSKNIFYPTIISKVPVIV